MASDGISERRTIDRVVGSNIRQARERAGMTREEVVADLALWGIEWSANVLSTVEGGRPLRLNEILGVCYVLDVTPAELVTTDRPVAHERAWVRHDSYRLAMEGRLNKIRLTEQQVDEGDPSVRTAVYIDGERANSVRIVSGVDGSVIRVEGDDVALFERWCPSRKSSGTTLRLLRLGRQGEATRNVADRLGIDRRETAALALELWNRSVHEERDARLDVSCSTGKTRGAAAGHITRAMIKEMQAYMDDHDLPPGRKPI